MTLIDDALIAQAQESLLDRAKAVQVKLGPSVETTFALNDIRLGIASYSIADWLSGEVWPYPKTQPALYVIQAGDVATATRLMKELPDAKPRDFAGAKVNINADASATLYVGSSEKIHTRLREHLWQASVHTYAMHLGRWCKVTEGEVMVSVRAILDCKNRVVRQDLEDTLWRSLSPRLGKSGGR